MSMGNGFEEWKKIAKFIDGSWCSSWKERIIKLSGKEILAPIKPGNKKYEAIELARGRFTKEK